MKKILNILNKTWLIILAAFLMIIIWNTTKYIKFSLIYNSKGEMYLYVLLGIIIFFLFYRTSTIMVKNEIYKFKTTWYIIMILIIIIQIAYTLGLKMVPIWDSRNVLNEAARMLRDSSPHISSVNGYYEMYGNNYFVVILFYLYYKMLHSLHITSYWNFTILLNLLAFDISVIISCYIVSKIKNKKSAFILLLICAFNPYTYIYVPFVYTSTLSVAAVMIEILFFYKLFNSIQKNESRQIIIYSILSVISVVGSFYLRATNFILVIACIIALGFYLLNKSNRYFTIRKFLLVTIVCVITLCCSLKVWKMVNHHYVSEQLIEQNYPVTHWVMMANKIGGRGQYNQSDELKTARYKTKSEKQEFNIRVLKKRFKSATLKELMKHFGDKLSVNWSEGIQYYHEIANSNQTYGWLYSIVSGKRSNIFSAYYQIFLIFIYLYGLKGVIYLLFERKICMSYIPFGLMVLGGIVFYLLWEVSPCYNICFMPILNIMALYGINDSNIEFEKKSPIELVVVIILLLIAGVGVTKGVKGLYDNYSICSVYRRPLLEKKISDLNKNNRKIRQSFVIQRKKRFNRVSFLVKAENKNKNIKYKFSLYKENGILLYEKEFINKQYNESEYYYDVELPQKYGEGSYYFTITPACGKKRDSLKFIYTTLEVVDNNPRGYLMVKNKIHRTKSDLIFNVYEQ